MSDMLVVPSIQMVGHRAFRGLYPENTLIAFDKAYEAKVDIIETDLQMTLDGIIVINHDSNTGRTWDKDFIISETTWDQLKSLRNKNDSTQRMLTLNDILTWSLDHPNCRLMLDIKFTNNKLILLRVYSELLAIKNDLDFWRSKVIWGVWLLDWFEFGVQTNIFKDFKIIVITMSYDIIKQFIDYSIKLNNPHYKLYGISVHYISTWTRRFRDYFVPMLIKKDIKLFIWTINNKIDFKYIIGLPLYGTVTDNIITTRKYIVETYMDHYSPKGQIDEDGSNRSLLNEYVTPVWTSWEGIRFYTYIQIYYFVSTLLFSKWIHKEILGVSFAYLMFKLLKLIRFF